MNQAIRYGKCELISRIQLRVRIMLEVVEHAVAIRQVGQVAFADFPAGIGDCDVQQFVRRVDAEFYDAAVFGIFYGDGQGVVQDRDDETAVRVPAYLCWNICFEPDIKAYCHFRECFEDALGNSRDVDSGDFRRLVSRFYPPEFEQIRNE